jgi:hypothetical protein
MSPKGSNPACGRSLPLQFKHALDGLGQRENVLARLRPEERQDVLQHGVIKRYSVGETIFTQAAAHGYSYFILNGLVRTSYQSYNGRVCTVAYWTKDELVGGPLPTFRGRHMGPFPCIMGLVKNWSMARSTNSMRYAESFVTKAFATKYPKVVIGWLRAELDAHKILRDHPNYAAQLIFDDWKRYNVPLEVIKQDFLFKFFPDAITPEWRNVLVDGAAFLQSHKFIENAVNFDTFINDSYLKQAAAIPSQLDESAISK